MRRTVAAGLLASGVIRLTAAAQQPDACERLARVALPNASITSAARVDAGTFAPPAGRRGATEKFAELPAFCRITTTTQIPPSSEAKTEIWLPLSGWTQELQPAGGGFYGGNIPYARMREIL